MPKPASITYEQVADACKNLLTDGKKPTCQAVAAVLQTTASMATVHKMVSRWKTENVPAATPIEEISVTPELAALMARYRQEADHIARSTVSEEMQLQKQDQESLVSELEKAEQLNETLTAEIERLKADLAAAQAHAENITEILSIVREQKAATAAATKTIVDTIKKQELKPETITDTIKETIMTIFSTPLEKNPTPQPVTKTTVKR